MMEEEEKNKSKWRRSCLILYTSNSNLNEISFIFFEIFVFYHRSNYSKFFGAVINIFWFLVNYGCAAAAVVEGPFIPPAGPFTVGSVRVFSCAINIRNRNESWTRQPRLGCCCTPYSIVRYIAGSSIFCIAVHELNRIVCTQRKLSCTVVPIGHFEFEIYFSGQNFIFTKIENS